MNRISSKYILNSLTSSEFNFKNINEMDVYDFIGDAIQLLGYGLFKEVVHKQTSVDFYKILYPCAVLNMLNVYYNGKIVSKKKCKAIEEHKPFGWLEETIVNKTKLLQIQDRLREDHSEESLEDRELLLRDIISNFNLVTTHNYINIDNEHWVDFKDNLIETNIEYGVVYLEYSTFAVDNEGLPLLYDEIKYLTFIKYYCACALVQGGYEHPTLSYPDLVMLKDKWYAKARNEYRKMNQTQMDDFKANWTNILKNSQDTNLYNLQ